MTHFYFDIDAWELYDLEKDPDEINNIYDNPEYKNIIDELKKELQKLREKYNLVINKKKTQFVAGKKLRDDVRIVEGVERVNDYKYLGVKVT